MSTNRALRMLDVWREVLRRPARSLSFVERDLDVRTAEAVAVRFELAGLGSRFLALAADLALQLLVVLAVVVVMIVYGVIAVDRAVAPGGSVPAAKFGGALFIALTTIASFVRSTRTIWPNVTNARRYSSRRLA